MNKKQTTKVVITPTDENRVRTYPSMTIEVPKTPKGKITKRGWEMVFKALEALKK